MRAARLTFGVLAATTMAHALAQTPYPDLTLQDMAWNSGTHHYGVTQKILSPSTPALPMDISGTADAEFVSGTQVRLRPGFHAGGFASETEGRFRARIDQTLGPVGDVIIISPAPDGSEPYGSIVDNVIHVHKWEKVEVGLRLPQEYQDAIDGFFRHYYRYNYPSYPPNNSLTNVATPGDVDAAHDLNPYADDSLQLVMTLTRPDGSQTMKWGFYMKEGKWASAWDGAKPAVDPAAALYPYHARFRFTPDKEGPWNIHLSVKAPYTLGQANTGLPDLTYSGLALYCNAPLPDNNGHLRVNQANRRALEFEGDEDDPDDQTPFFGLGVNMADVRNKWWAAGPSDREYGLQKRDFKHMRESMEQLHEVGGNFMRIWMFRNIFNVEWVNTGVYDAYRTPQVCDLNAQPPWPDCGNGGWTTGYLGNCQAHTWALDSLLLVARANNIYVQLCIDAHPPIINYERYHWGANPYVSRFLEPHRLPHPSVNPLDMKRFFFTPDTPLTSPDNVFYWWKRKYKYIMSRWGYSVNVPIIEPFNEFDQTPSYRRNDLSPDSCNHHAGMCFENRVLWEADLDLPLTYSDWLTEIISFVKDPVNPGNPTSLGERKKLFIAGTDYEANEHPNYKVPNKNPKLDLIDVHHGLYDQYSIRNQATKVDDYRTVYASNGVKRPFNHGEFTHYTDMAYYGKKYEIGNFFHNYDIAFHNEIWSGAFSGKFATGNSWLWQRVFWWDGAQEPPPDDPSNLFDSGGPTQFTNIPGEWNEIMVNGGQDSIQNKPSYHNFRPLADLLYHPSWLDLDFFNGDYKASRNADFSGLDAYYLQNILPPDGRSDMAIGWVQNRNASLFKSYYLASTVQEFLSCQTPSSTTLWLDGFEPGTYYITWFPTRLNSTVQPPDDQIVTTVGGGLEIDLSNQFNGISNNYLDTLRSDFAFIITPEPFVKRRRLNAVIEEPTPEQGWDFALYPNPTRGEFTLVFEDDAPKDVVLLDVTGRQLAHHSNVITTVLQLQRAELPQGTYCIRVSDGLNRKSKKLLIH